MFVQKVKESFKGILMEPNNSSTAVLQPEPGTQKACVYLPHRTMNTETPTVKEVQWTDDAIRWQGGLHGDLRDEQSNANDDRDNGCMVDPFADPDPTELQTYQFVVPSFDGLGIRSCDSGSCDAAAGAADKDKGTKIEVTIRGYKTGADAVWKSTGLTLWKASLYLCQYQVENPHLFQGRVLELGAGLGLNGILGWKMMCAFPSESAGDYENSVCITDGDSDTLVHLRENIQRNKSAKCNATIPAVSCHQLLWGADTSRTFLTHIAHKKYQTILASDIIYAPSIIEPLWETIQALLEPKGVFVMAFAKRKVPVSIELVLESAKQHEFRYELMREDLEEGIWVYIFQFV